MKQPHQILGVKKNPTLAEVKTAYKELCRRYHPDLHPGEEETYTILMSEVNAAYDYFKKLLSDSEKDDTDSTKSTSTQEKKNEKHEYTDEEKQRMWEETKARWDYQSKIYYANIGKKMRDKVARQLEPIRDLNKKFIADIQRCTTFQNLKNLSTEYATRVEEVIMIMYEYAEKQHRYGMPPESSYYTEVFNDNVNKNFPLDKVESSYLAAIGYDEKNQLLYIQFNNGARYVYYDVVNYVFQGFKNSLSKGKYYLTYIKNKYKYTRLLD